MASYNTTLIRKRGVAENTLEFTLKKPEGYKFKAGQHLEMSFKEAPQKGSHIFSFCGSPKEDLIFATRFRSSSFKEYLKNISLEEEVLISDAIGDMTLHGDDSKSAIFIAGGIGITPMMSILKDSLGGVSRYMQLFYSNKSINNASYFNELKEMSNNCEQFEMVPTFTKEEMGGYEKGRINKEIFEKYIDDIKSSVFYIAGSPEFVSGMKNILDDMGVDDLCVKSEEFGGY